MFGRLQAKGAADSQHAEAEAGSPPDVEEPLEPVRLACIPRQHSDRVPRPLKGVAGGED